VRGLVVPSDFDRLGMLHCIEGCLVVTAIPGYAH
jgi:hypothetical protein